MVSETYLFYAKSPPRRGEWFFSYTVLERLLIAFALCSALSSSSISSSSSSDDYDYEEFSWSSSSSSIPISCSRFPCSLTLISDLNRSWASSAYSPLRRGSTDSLGIATLLDSSCNFKRSPLTVFLLMIASFDFLVPSLSISLLSSLCLFWMYCA